MSQFEFKMPRMGESITQAAIINWFKGVGDTIEFDEILLEVATDKVDSEVPSPVSGKIVELLYEPNDVVDIGSVIAIIETNGELPVVPSETGKSKPAKKEAPKSTSETKRKKKPIQAGSFQLNEDLFVSPLVDSIARAHHISYEELARIPGNGKRRTVAKERCDELHRRWQALQIRSTRDRKYRV